MYIGPRSINSYLLCDSIIFELEVFYEFMLAIIWLFAIISYPIYKFISSGIGLPYAIYKSYIRVIFYSAVRKAIAPSCPILFLDTSRWVSVWSWC